MQYDLRNSSPQRDKKEILTVLELIKPENFNFAAIAKVNLYESVSCVKELSLLPQKCINVTGPRKFIFKKL